MYDLMVIEMVS